MTTTASRPRLGTLLRRRKGRVALAAAVALCAASTGVAVAVTSGSEPGPQPGGTAITPEGWHVTPAGSQTTLNTYPQAGGPLAVTLTPDGSRVLVASGGFGAHSLVVLNAGSSPAAMTQPPILQATSSAAAFALNGYFVGLAVSPDGTHAWASNGPGNSLHVFTVSAGVLSETAGITLSGGSFPAGIAVSADGTRLFVAGAISGQLIKVDAVQGKQLSAVNVGHFPYGVALSHDGSRAYVSNWGADSVSVVDTATMTVADTVTVGMHPCALTLDPMSDRLYVANSDSDTVSVIDTGDSDVLGTISLDAAGKGRLPGASPNALAVSPDGRTLYVANAGDNDVAVVDVARHGRRHGRYSVLGLIPTGWYPTGVALDPAGKTLFVINYKGLGVGPVPPGSYNAAQLRGTLSRIDVPSPAALAADTATVLANNHFLTGGDLARGASKARRVGQKAVAARCGSRSPIHHIIYVMKENRTYDTMLGDLGRGNGAPQLELFPDVSVTPNQHALARQFVTLDNFFADGEVSVDGWSWATTANCNTFLEKTWPMLYSGHAWPFDPTSGDAATLPGANAREASFAGAVQKAGISYRNYGFLVTGDTLPVSVPPALTPLQGHTDLNYNGFTLTVPDQVRCDEWLKEFKGFVANGNLPTVEFVYFSRDHTLGTTTGAPTPSAMVADNDLALGRLVDAVSHSRYWKDTAIFVIEDDAQDGPDHVDGHRMIAQVISPYTQTGKVDSTFYSQVSALRTMEMILGLDPLTQYDATATPMFASFTGCPNLKPYTAITPTQSLASVNAKSAPGAAASGRMNFSVPDQAPEGVLNKLIWQSVKGSKGAYPGPSGSGDTAD